MRWACVLLCACNQVYGLDPTVARDAEYFDAPIDAPYSCPALGTPPVFSPKLSQLLFDCRSYTASPAKNLAIAMCVDVSEPPLVSIGPVDGPFTPLAGMPVATANLEVSDPQLSPDGELFLLHLVDVTTITSTVRVYRNVGGTWVQGTDLPLPFATTTPPSSAPDRRVIYQTRISGDLHELREDATGMWSEAPVHPIANIGAPSLRLLWLAPDALRMLFAVNPTLSPDQTYLAYSERASKADAFGPLIRTELPRVFDPFITDDCSRIYFTGLRSIFYAKRL